MTYTKPLNIVLIGDPGTGKTNLLSQLAKNHFNPKYEPSTGITEITYDIHVDAQTVETDIWELAGRKKYRRLADSLLCDADGILLVYDISDPATFDDLTAWLSFIRQAAPNAVIKLVGNKNDLQRRVPNIQAYQFAIDNRLSYIETSALNGSHVRLTFESMAQEINVATQSVPPPVLSTESFVQKDSKASSGHDIEEKPFQVVLVDIEQTASAEEVVCVEKPLDEANLEFVAISYRWGEVQEQVVDTKLGYRTGVTSFALADFYRLCRDMMKETDLQSIKYVWVDAICVDQNNHARRKATIYQMSNIYHRAAYILAVPDLHLEYLKNNQIFSCGLKGNVSQCSEFIYSLFQEDTDRLVLIMEYWFDEMNIPKATMAREELTSCPTWWKRFTDFLVVYNVHTESPCSSDCEHNCYGAWPPDCHDAPKVMLDYIQHSINECHGHSENTTIVYENKDCALCSLQMDMCKHQGKSLNKNETIPDSDQKWLACVLREVQYDNFRNLVSDRAKAITEIMKYFEYLIKDWSSRAWVISECNIAKAKPNPKMKFWFLSLMIPSLNDVKIDDKLRFYVFDFDKDALDLEDTASSEVVLYHAYNSYNNFQSTLRSQLDKRSFLEMMLGSKASRNEDRFYAVLPSSEYKAMLTTREVVSSWQIDNILSVKLKLLEFMNIKDKLDLLCWMAFSNSEANCIFPAFANINLDIRKLSPIKERHEKRNVCNFDLYNNDTLRLVPPDVLLGNEDGFHKLNLTPKMYSVLCPDANRSAKSHRADRDQRFWEALDINYVDDDAVYVRIPLYMYYFDQYYDGNDILLLGSFKKNKWLLCSTSTGKYVIGTVSLYGSWKDFTNHDGNISFDIY